MCSCRCRSTSEISSLDLPITPIQTPGASGRGSGARARKADPRRGHGQNAPGPALRLVKYRTSLKFRIPSYLHQSTRLSVCPLQLSFQSVYHICTSWKKRGARLRAHKLRPRGCRTDKQAPQKCRQCTCIAFQSRSRLYIDAVSMAKPRSSVAMGKEIDSTSYEPSNVRCAFVFFLCFALAGTEFRPVGSVKTLCTYLVRCTRRCAALRVKARR